MDNKLKDLDDINKELRRETRAISRRPAHRRNSAMHRRRGFFDEIRENRVMFVVPLIVIVLILVIKVLEPAFGLKEETLSNQPETAYAGKETAAAEQMNAQETVPETTQDPTIVSEVSDEELTDFFKQYFKARLNCDTDAIYQMTGTENQSEEQTKALKAQLKTQAGYIEQYKNIKTYAAKGMKDDERIVFLTYNVKFRRVDTVAPSIMYCYIKRTDKGLQIVENVTPEQRKFINNYTTKHEEVTELVNNVNSQLLQVLTSDPRLAIYYDALQTGRIYNEDQASIDSEVSLVGESAGSKETTAAGETAATEAPVEVAADPNGAGTAETQSQTPGSASGAANAETAAQPTAAAN